MSGTRCFDTCCRGDYEEYPVVIQISSKRVKANKRHKCYECGQNIYPGNTYIRVAEVWIEGDTRTVFASKYHLGPCQYGEDAGSGIDAETEGVG